MPESVFVLEVKLDAECEEDEASMSQLLDISFRIRSGLGGQLNTTRPVGSEHNPSSRYLPPSFLMDSK